MDVNMPTKVTVIYIILKTIKDNLWYTCNRMKS